MREHTTCLVFSAFLFASAIQAGEVMNPIERQLGDRFPSVALNVAAKLPVVVNAPYLETAGMAPLRRRTERSSIQRRVGRRRTHFRPRGVGKICTNAGDL